MPVNMNPINEDLDGIETEKLIDILADCTSRYTRLLLTDPNGEEFAESRDKIQHIQDALRKRISLNNTDENQADRA